MKPLPISHIAFSIQALPMIFGTLRHRRDVWGETVLFLIIIHFRMNDPMAEHGCRQILFAGLGQASASLFREVGRHGGHFPDNFAFSDQDLKCGLR